jgi:hypothetical protein
MSAVAQRLPRLILRLAVALTPRARRADLVEQWSADLAGAAELDLSPVSVSVGVLRTALHPTTWKDAPMLPIGPLAIALRYVHGPNATRQAIPIAVALLAVLLLGIGLLVAA